MLSKAYGAFDKIRKGGMLLAIAAVFVMMAYITADVFVRNFLPVNMVGTYEFTQAFLMPLIGFPAMPYAYQIGLLPRIIMVTDRARPELKRILALALPIVHGALFVAMGVFSTRYALQSVADRITVLCGTRQLPVYPLYFLPCYAFFMIALEDLFVLVKNVMAKGRDCILFED